MTQREIDLKAIIKHLSIWEVNLSNLNSLNLQDGNLISEHQIAQTLNCIFGYRLKNANASGKNYPAIDLIDDANSLAVQITSTPSVKKIQYTLNKFVEYRLQQTYDRLIVMILGKRQKSYPSLLIPECLIFDPKNDILDFNGLLNVINYLPSAKLGQLKSILLSADKREHKSTLVTTANLQKKALAMEKKFLKDFVDSTLSKKELEDAYYEPRVRLNFGSAIIRDVGDRTFPGGDPEQPKWTKLEFSGLYDYGVEFIRQGLDVIFDKHGYWDLLKWDDPRSKKSEYKIMHYWVFYRLSYQDIEVYDLEADGYYGYPTIFCHFKYDGWPWEEVKFGRPGFASQRERKHYFDDAKRRSLP